MTGPGNLPDGGTAKMVMTLGYDPVKKKFVGTLHWVDDDQPLGV